MPKHIDTGLHGERISATFLMQKGYKILERNWRFKKYEIDIIAFFNNILVIIEVKSRAGAYIQQPFEAVNRKKQRFLIEAANAYVEKNNIELETRFDIISIIEKNGKYNIEHIEDAFYPLV